jgi:hypothetical protein
MIFLIKGLKEAMMIKSVFFTQKDTPCKMVLALIAALFIIVPQGYATETPALLGDCGRNEAISLASWPNTNFSICTVPLDEIMSGGPGKDDIPAVDDVTIRSVREAAELTDNEPVISMTIRGQSRAWPLRYLIWHEIANDNLGGTPIAVTYCPLCNAAIVFDRRIGDKVLDFGTTGNLRKSDLVMYDRQTESWWQQFTGEAIIGRRAGQILTPLASRLEDWKSFKTRNPNGTVMGVDDLGFRPYGANPYRGYDTSAFPFLYDGEVPEGIAPLARVVVVGEKAWSLDLIRQVTPLKTGDLIISWKPGQNSALDSGRISNGRDIGTVTVRSKMETGTGFEDVPYDVTFAFVFHAFKPDGTLVIADTDLQSSEIACFKIFGIQIPIACS